MLKCVGEMKPLKLRWSQFKEVKEVKQNGLKRAESVQVNLMNIISRLYNK